MEATKEKTNESLKLACEVHNLISFFLDSGQKTGGDEDGEYAVEIAADSQLGDTADPNPVPEGRDPDSPVIRIKFWNVKTKEIRSQVRVEENFNIVVERGTAEAFIQEAGDYGTW